jgi:hypothetical protein
MQHTLAKQLEAGPTIALSFDPFQLGHMALDHAVVLRKGQSCQHCGFVSFHASKKALQFSDLAGFHAAEPIYASNDTSFTREMLSKLRDNLYDDPQLLETRAFTALH